MTASLLRAALLSTALSCALVSGQQAPSRPDAWPRFRGSAALLGVADAALARPLELAWSFEAKDGVASSAAIVDGSVYVGSRDGVLSAIDLATGKARWQ